MNIDKILSLAMCIGLAEFVIEITFVYTQLLVSTVLKSMILKRAIA